MIRPAPTHVAIALGEFALFDICRPLGLRVLKRMTGRARPRRGPADDADAQRTREALKWAVSLYFKKAHCLQRSWTLTRMLRRQGIPASLAIGYKSATIEPHAWVEVNGLVFDGEGKGHRFFQVLDRW